MYITPLNTIFVVLSFEEPDAYCMAGGMVPSGRIPFQWNWSRACRAAGLLETIQKTFSNCKPNCIS